MEREDAEEEAANAAAAAEAAAKEAEEVSPFAHVSSSGQATHVAIASISISARCSFLPLPSRNFKSPIQICVRTDREGR